MAAALPYGLVLDPLVVQALTALDLAAERAVHQTALWVDDVSMAAEARLGHGARDDEGVPTDALYGDPRYGAALDLHNWLAQLRGEIRAKVEAVLRPTGPDAELTARIHPENCPMCPDGPLCPLGGEG